VTIFPPGCCARVARGHAVAPPRSVMKSRRLLPNMAFHPASRVGTPTRLPARYTAVALGWNAYA
jgi:hypothetical protein